MSDTELKPLPCPHCGIELTANDCRDDLYVRRYGIHYEHPSGACFMADTEVSPGNIEAWNERTSQQAIAQLSAERDLLRGRLEAVEKDAARWNTVSGLTWRQLCSVWEGCRSGLGFTAQIDEHAAIAAASGKEGRG